jgi:hypothetical protein
MSSNKPVSLSMSARLTAAMSLTGPLEDLQVVRVGRIGRVADQEGAVLAGHSGPPIRRAAAFAISRTLSTSIASPVSVT